MNKRLEVFFDDGNYLAGKSTTIILENGKIDLHYLLALLNSKLISFWFMTYFRSLKLSGGYLRIGNNEIKKIPIASPDNPNCYTIVALVQKIQELTSNEEYHLKPDLQSKVYDFQIEIDQLVYQLYGLTEEEIVIVEESVGR